MYHVPFKCCSKYFGEETPTSRIITTLHAGGWIAKGLFYFLAVVILNYKWTEKPLSS